MRVVSVQQQIAESSVSFSSEVAVSISTSKYSVNHEWQQARTLDNPFNPSPGAANVRSKTRLHIYFAKFTSLYNDAVFSDVTILILGQRPMPSKAAHTLLPCIHSTPTRSSSLLDLVFCELLLHTSKGVTAYCTNLLLDLESHA